VNFLFSFLLFSTTMVILLDRGQTVKAVALLTVAAGVYCIYKDPKRLKRRAWERVSFFLCQRDLKERDMEKRLLEQRKLP
jgi:hypothetical protein